MPSEAKFVIADQKYLEIRKQLHALDELDLVMRTVQSSQHLIYPPVCAIVVLLELDIGLEVKLEIIKQITAKIHFLQLVTVLQKVDIR
jgi:hypothetical protein